MQKFLRNFFQIENGAKFKKNINHLIFWYGFNILLKGSLRGQRDKIINKLIKHKIEVRPTMTGNFVKNPVIKYLDHQIKGSLNSSEYIHQNGFLLEIIQKI